MLITLLNKIKSWLVMAAVLAGNNITKFPLRPDHNICINLAQVGGNHTAMNTLISKIFIYHDLHSKAGKSPPF